MLRCVSAQCTCTWGGFFTSFAYLLRALRLSLAMCGSPNNGEDFPYLIQIFNMLYGPSRNLPMGACYSNPRVNTRLLSTHSPQVITPLLCFHRVLQVGAGGFSPLVNTYLLTPTALGLTPVCCVFIDSCMWECVVPALGVITGPLNTYNPHVNSRPLHLHGNQVVTLPSCPHSHRAIASLLRGGYAPSISCLVPLLTCMSEALRGMP